MSTLKRSFVNMLTGGLGYVVPMVINLLFTPLLVSRLGEAAYGLQSLVNVIIGYLMVADMGLDIPVIKYVAEYSAKKDWQMLNKILNNTFQVYLIIGFLGMSIIGLLADIFIERLFDVPLELHSEAKQVFRLAALGFAGSVLSMWGRAACNGMHRYDISNGVGIVSNFLSTLLGIALVVFGYGVVGYIAMRVIFSFISGIVYIYVSRRILPVFKFAWGFDSAVWKLLRSQVGYGFILRISGILGSGLDRTFIGAWIGVAAVGVYAIPFLIASSISYLMSSMTHFIFPMTSALHSNNKTQELISLYLKGSKFIVLIASLLFIPILLFGDKFLSLWIGVDLSAKISEVLFLLCASFYLNSILYLMANVFMIGIGKIDVFTKFAVSKSVLMVVGFVLLIKPYGIEGAGYAMVLSCIVDLVFFMVTVKQYLGVKISVVLYASYVKPVSLALIVAAATYLLRPLADNWAGLIGSCAIFVSAYIGAGLYFKMLEEEKAIVLRLWNNVRTRS